MARKRMIDPEFWSDEEIGAWSFPARLFYIGLWNFADDEGRFRAHPALLKSQVFPYEQKVDIKALQAEINSKVAWYEVGNSKYGHLKNFAKYQRIDRPSPSKIPGPDEASASVPGKLDEDSTSARRGLAPNIREVKRSKEKITATGAVACDSFSRSSLLSMFERIWIRYPRREGKQDALKQFCKQIRTEADWLAIKTALENYKDHLEKEKTDVKYIQQGGRWFGKSWYDWRSDPAEPNEFTKHLCGVQKSNDG